LLNGSGFVPQVEVQREPRHVRYAVARRDAGG
jgi:hypothetical protein